MVYQIGDKVWSLYSLKPCEWTIAAIEISKTGAMPETRYYSSKSFINSDNKIHQSDIFPTKEALFEKINSNFQ